MKATAIEMGSSSQKMEEEWMKYMAKPYIFTPTKGFINSNPPMEYYYQFGVVLHIGKNSSTDLVVRDIALAILDILHLVLPLMELRND